MADSALRGRALTGLVGQSLNLVIGAIASVPIARGLGPVGKGKFAFYSWAITVTVLVLGWGWHEAIATVVSQDPSRGVGAIRACRRLLFPAVTAACLVGGLSEVREASGWGWAAAAAALQIWGLPASGALIGEGRLSAYYSGLLAQNSLVLVCLLTMWRVLGTFSPEFAICCVAIGVATSMIIHSLAAGAGFGFGVHPVEIDERFAAIARNNWLANLATFMTYRFDILIVRGMLGFGPLGLYSTATGIAELSRIVPNVFGQASIRELGAAAPVAQAAAARRAVHVGFPASLVSGLVSAVAAPWLIPLIYGPSFAPAAWLVACLAPGVAMLAIASVAAGWLNVAGRSYMTARLAWVTCAISSALYAALIPTMGLTGAALASSLSYALSGAAMWRAASRG